MEQITKVQAVVMILNEQGGSATWQKIYGDIERFYPTAKKSKAWKEGIRGVVYREIRSGRTFRIDSKGVVTLAA